MQLAMKSGLRFETSESSESHLSMILSLEMFRNALITDGKINEQHFYQTTRFELLP